MNQPRLDPRLIQILQKMDPQWMGALPSCRLPVPGLPSDWAVRLEAEPAGQARLTPEQLATFFQVPVSQIQAHLDALEAEGELGQGLEVLFAVGFRVVSPCGAQFRKWATTTLGAFTIRGYLLDCERLAQEGPWHPEAWEHLAEELQEIRLSSRAFFQRLTDLYATALDYDKEALTTRTLWGRVMAFALVGGLPKPALLALPVLDDCVALFLNYADRQASAHVPMTMIAWAERLDLLLRIPERDLFERPGEVVQSLNEGLTL